MREHVLAVQPEARRPRRHGRHRRRRRADVQHLDRRRARRRRGGRRRREARQPRRVVGVRLGGRPRGARLRRSSCRPSGSQRSIDELGFGFLFAPTHHPAMRHAAPVRRELGDADGLQRARPADEPGRRAGAGRRRLRARSSCRRSPTVLAQLGARRAFVVHGAGGIDELSPAGPNLVCEVVDGEVRRREIDPLDFGVPRCASAELARRLAGRERRDDPRDLRGRAGRRSARRCS